jgi:hypothetical protein
MVFNDAVRGLETLRSRKTKEGGGGPYHTKISNPRLQGQPPLINSARWSQAGGQD